MNTFEIHECPNPSQPLGLGSTEGLGLTRFAPTVTMPGGGVVTPEGWMWVLGFALAGCDWAIEAAERDGLHQKAMDYRRRQRIYWQEREVAAAEERLADAGARLDKEKATLAALVGPNVEFSGVPAGHSSNHPAGGTSAGTQG